MNVEARHLRKCFGNRVALDGVEFTVGEGRIVGVIGPNGAGKSTLFQAILGLIRVEGEVRVAGLDPWQDRVSIMRSSTFIADSTVMPAWLTVANAFDYYAAVHPGFDRERAAALLSDAGLQPRDRVASLSKGLAAQLHLSLAMSVHARLMVLDEPTLGLDLLARQRFFDALLERYAEQQPTVLIATHAADEIQHVVTDLLFLDEGRVLFQCTMEDYERRFVEVEIHPEHLEIARDLGPIHERPTLGGTMLLFDGADRRRLSLFGELRRPQLSSLFQAVVQGPRP